MTHQGGLADLEASATAADPSQFNVICRLVGKGKVTPVKHTLVLILSFSYSRPAFRAKLFPVEVGFAARRPYCSAFDLFWPLHKLFGLLDIQSFQAAGY